MTPEVAWAALQRINRDLRDLSIRPEEVMARQDPIVVPPTPSAEAMLVAEALKAGRWAQAVGLAERDGFKIVELLPLLDGWVPEAQRVLLEASARGDLGFIKLLLATGMVDADDFDDLNEANPLIKAAKFGHVEVVKFLLDEAEVELEAESRSGTRALHAAFMSGHLSVVTELLHRGAELEAEIYNDGTRSPLPSLSATWNSSSCS